MRRSAYPLALLAALVAALPAAAARAPVRASATLGTRAVLFGDRVLARVDVVVDARTVDPARTALTAPLGTWTELGATLVSTTRAGELVRRRWQLAIACRTSGCAPTGAAREAHLPAARVTIVRRDGSVRHLTVRWPSLLVASRLPASADKAAAPPFALQVTPPPPRLAIGASTAATLLGVAAGLLAVAALALVGLELRRRRVPAAARVSPLARALALAREAQGRPPADRRRALALLARVATPRDAALSSDAAATAWEQPDPDPERVAELVRRAERLRDAP